MTSDRLYLTRLSQRRTSDNKLSDQIDWIATQAISKSHIAGWAYKKGPITALELSWNEAVEVAKERQELSQCEWKFTTFLEFYRTCPAARDPQEAVKREAIQREDIYGFVSALGQNARFQGKPWTVKVKSETVELNTAIISDQVHKPVIAPVIDPISDPEPIPLSKVSSSIQPGDYYSHLYGLDAQIRILLSTIRAAADSNMKYRFHSLLYGAPGAGKTDILISTYKLLSDLNISCLSIDCTSTTEAGMRKLLLDEDEIIPEVILAEEIEKAPHSFKLLLGIMDDRGVVSQLNARRTASRKVPALVLASANDYGALLKMDSGALLSRFSNEIYCPRPDREILAKILEREIGNISGGKLEWIEPTLKFCFDERGITDPRTVRNVCLCGRDRLLDGSHQEDLKVTMRKNRAVDQPSEITSRPVLQTSIFR